MSGDDRGLGQVAHCAPGQPPWGIIAATASYLKLSALDTQALNRDVCQVLLEYAERPVVGAPSSAAEAAA